MIRLPIVLSAAVAALLLTSIALASDATDAWQHLIDAPETQRAAGGTVTFAVDLSPDASPGYSVDTVDGKRIARYRMAFNNIAEGWSWQPEVAVGGGDYYRYKFLPLGSTMEDRGRRSGWGPLGGEFTAPVRWRFDYFAGFDNPYDFYARGDDPDAGFSAVIPADAVEPLRMEVRLRLAASPTSESTTYWRAVPGRPVELTLKNRYFLGKVEAVRFIDARGKVLVTVAPMATAEGKAAR